MAINTAERRFSMMGFGDVVSQYVVPSGTVGAAARATFLDLYSGIALDVPAEAEELVCNLLALISTRAVSLDAPIDDSVTNLEADIEC